MRKKPKAFVVTRAELARLVRCTPDRLTKLVAEGLPVRSTGGGRGKPTTFELAQALPWLLQRRSGTLDEERQRYFKLQADRIEQDVRHRAGELVEASEVEARSAARTIAARERLLQLPGTAVQRGVPDAHEDLLIALVDGALRELAAKGGYVEP
jgi:phage terminase Nu1 subunit (DNA packaging protein)